MCAYRGRMQRILEVLSDQATSNQDDIHLGWEISANSYRLSVLAATREQYATRDEAWEAAKALVAALSRAVDSPPRTDDILAVLAVPSEVAHDERHPLTGYRGQVRIVWKMSAFGDFRGGTDEEPEARLIV